MMDTIIAYLFEYIEYCFIYRLPMYLDDQAVDALDLER